MRVLYAGSGWLDVPARLAAVLGEPVATWDRRTPLVDVVGDVEVLLPSNALIDAAVIAGAPRLRLIQQPAAGYEGIDLGAARAAGVPVCNAPRTNHTAVAEAALLLLLLLARRWPAAQAAFACGEIGAPIGHELAGRTLGIVGPGRAGTALADRARALGMHVRLLDRRACADAAARAAFIAGHDAVSLHCPLTDRTRGLIYATALAALHPGALLVNVARGAVIDRPALEAALASGHLGGVGLDVFWQEPWDVADPLWRHPRVVTLPHVAGSSDDALAQVVALVAANIGRMRRGEPLAFQLC